MSFCLYRQMFGGSQSSIGGYVKRIIDDDSDSDEEQKKNIRNSSTNLPVTDLLTDVCPFVNP